MRRAHRRPHHGHLLHHHHHHHFSWQPREPDAAPHTHTNGPLYLTLTLTLTLAPLDPRMTSRVTLIHGLSLPIGAHFHVPHGLSNAMLLPAVTAFSLPGAPVRYAECSRAMGFATEEDDVTAAGAKLLSGLTGAP